MQSLVHRFGNIFSESLSALQKQVPEDVSEKIIMRVYRVMEGKNRKFHSAAHVLDVAEGLSPMQKIAVFFHDYVYVQVDNGFSSEDAFLHDYVLLQGTEAELRTETPENAVWDLVLSVFGVMRGQVLTIFSGLNELLSAFVMSECLKEYFSERELIELVAYVEATVPFRKNMPYEKLSARLSSLLRKKNIAADGEEVRRIVRAALNTANSDTANFSNPDVAFFLAKTWELLPESNNFISQIGVYSVRYYREVLLKNYNFMVFMNGETVFHRFEDYPDEQTYTKLVRQTDENLRISREYLAVKLLNQGILEAVATETGGDVPISYFLGDARNYENIRNIENYLPEIKNEREDCTPEVKKLLLEGRLHPSAHDLKNSPLAAYCYRFMSKAEFEKSFESAKKMFAGEISAKEMLQTVPRELLLILLRGIGEIAVWRKEKIEKLIQEFA
jgi:hypothetical protein